MWGQVLDTNDKNILTLKAKELSLKYHKYLDPKAILQEIIFLKSVVQPFREGAKSLETATNLEVLNILTTNGLQQQFTNIHTALRIFLTNLASVASNERFFWNFKIILNYLRSLMGQERLTGLGILCIEHIYAEKL